VCVKCVCVCVCMCVCIYIITPPGGDNELMDKFENALLALQVEVAMMQRVDNCPWRLKISEPQRRCPKPPHVSVPVL